MKLLPANIWRWKKSQVNGGAVAFAILSARPARITATLIHELNRRSAHYGVASACMGGGHGISGNNMKILNLLSGSELME
jgi:acetyl-CoA acetyltransferase